MIKAKRSFLNSTKKSFLIHLEHVPAKKNCFRFLEIVKFVIGVIFEVQSKILESAKEKPSALFSLFGFKEKFLLLNVFQNWDKLS